MADKAPAGDLAAIRRAAVDRLRSAGIGEAEADVRVLLRELFDLSLTDLVTGSRSLGESDRRRLDEALSRRIAGEPVHRIVGAREFYGLRLNLSPATLEPRADTEVLVDAMRPFVSRAVERTGACSILDLGTGTGAIALALLACCDRAHALGVDLSAEALATASQNAERLGLASRFQTVKSAWFDNVAGMYDIIVSNPPYIVSNDIAGLDIAVRGHDPRLALDGGADGLDAYRAIAAGAGERLKPSGVVGVEIGADQAVSVGSLFAAEGFALHLQCRDLGGMDRVMVFSLAAESGSDCD